MHFHREKPHSTTPAGPKPALHAVQLPIFRVLRRALEEYFCRVYGWDEFDFLAATGTAPGQTPEYRVKAAIPDCTDGLRRADALRSGRRSRDVALILNVLCLDGYIPAGHYLVDTRPEPTPLTIYQSLLQQTGTPDAKECRAFRAAHRHDKTFTRLAAQIDVQVLATIQQQK